MTIAEYLNLTFQTEMTLVQQWVEFGMIFKAAQLNYEYIGNFYSEEIPTRYPQFRRPAGKEVALFAIRPDGKVKYLGNGKIRYAALIRKMVDESALQQARCRRLLITKASNVVMMPYKVKTAS